MGVCAARFHRNAEKLKIAALYVNYSMIESWGRFGWPIRDRGYFELILTNVSSLNVQLSHMGVRRTSPYASKGAVKFSSVICGVEYSLTVGNIVDFWGEMGRVRRTPSAAGIRRGVDYIKDLHSFILTVFHAMSGLLTLYLKKMRRKGRYIDRWKGRFPVGQAGSSSVSRRIWHMVVYFHSLGLGWIRSRF